MNTYKHSGGLGDLILGLPTVKALGGGNLYLYDHQHAVLGKLLDIQPYMKVIEVSFEEWKTLEVTHNLDKFRESGAISVAEMHLDAFGVKTDLAQPWIFGVEPRKVAKIIIHDTGVQRLPGYTIDWNVFREKGLEKDSLFIGYSYDYELFQRDKKLNIEYYKTEDLYEVARVIAGSQLFVGNQSCPYTIAEGMKHPLIIDLYEGKPQNPLGPEGFVNFTPLVFSRYLQ